MIVLGLTGSIGMGKTTTAGFFAKAGIPVYSADKAVHELYRKKAVIAEIASAFPDAVLHGRIDRKKLAAAVFGKPVALKKLESIIHPLVRKAETDFLQQARQEGHPLAVLDIPLLFETGSRARVDHVAVVSAPLAIQRQRVMSRPGMTEETFAAILARQMPDEEKRRHADFVIDTGKSLKTVRQHVRSLIKTLLAA